MDSMSVGCHVRSIVLTSILLPQVAIAQMAAASLAELHDMGKLRRGDTVYVTDIFGRLARGEVDSISSTLLSVTENRNTWTWDDSEIDRIELQDPLMNGIWRGLLVGASALYASCGAAILDARCGTALGHGWPYVALGGVIGAIVDSAVHKAVYQRPGGSRLRATLAATSGWRGGFGGRFRLAW